MTIKNYITYSLDYYKCSDIPVYVIPNDDFILLKLDYIGLFFPKIQFYKFDFIKSILTFKDLQCASVFQKYQVSKDKVVEMIDLTTQFKEFAKIEHIDFEQFPIIMFNLLRGYTYGIQKYKKEYVPLLPFFEFLGLDNFYKTLIKINLD